MILQQFFLGLAAHDEKSSLIAVDVAVTVEYEDGIDGLFIEQPQLRFVLFKGLPCASQLGNVLIGNKNFPGGELDGHKVYGLDGRVPAGDAEYPGFLFTGSVEFEILDPCIDYNLAVFFIGVCLLEPRPSVRYVRQVVAEHLPEFRIEIPIFPPGVDEGQAHRYILRKNLKSLAFYEHT